MVSSSGREIDPVTAGDHVRREPGTAGRRRIVLCVPRRCGLNDILVQIWQSYRLAVAEQRDLVIDTRVAGLWDDFDEYFELAPGVQEQHAPLRITGRVTSADIVVWNRSRVEPSRFEGQLDFVYLESRLRMRSFERRSRAGRMARFATMALRPSPDHELPWSRRVRFAGSVVRHLGSEPDITGAPGTAAEVVLHHRTGGGPDSVSALRLFTFTPRVRAAVVAALQHCGPDYDALHIRNTDLPADYRAMLGAARSRLAGRRVLVCSDDAEVIEEARRTLVDSEIITVTATEPTGGEPLHKVGWDRSLAERRRLATDQLVDLLCLATGRDLTVAPARNGGLSGYSRLALMLHDDPQLRAQLTGTATDRGDEGLESLPTEGFGRGT